MTAIIDKHIFHLSDDEALDWIVQHLDMLYGERGQQLWWNRPRRTLGGRTPREAWTRSRNEVLELALSGQPL